MGQRTGGGGEFGAGFGGSNPFESFMESLLNRRRQRQNPAGEGDTTLGSESSPFGVRQFGENQGIGPFGVRQFGEMQGLINGTSDAGTRFTSPPGSFQRDFFGGGSLSDTGGQLGLGSRGRGK